MRYPTVWYVRPAKPQSACAHAQSDQGLCWSLEYSTSVKLLIQHHLVFLSLNGWGGGGAAPAGLGLRL